MCPCPETFEDSKVVIKSRKSKWDNGPEKMVKSVVSRKNGQQWSTKHYKESLRLRNTNLTKNRGELRWFGRVISSCTTSGTRRTIIANPVISHEWGHDRIVITTKKPYPDH